VDTEIMLVAGAGEREVEYRESRWGPVITALLEPGVTGEYALQGLPFAVTDRDPFVAMVGMMRATDLDALREAIVDWSTPSANLVAAGPGGQIFYTVVGDIPLRSPLSPLGGMIAQDGSSTAYDWVDLIPNDYKPWVLDPAAGYLLSANHRPVADWYPLPLGVGQGGGGDTLRSRRLRELLQALPATVEPQAVLDDVQWDCVNAARRDLVALGAHVRALQPGRLSPDTHALLDAFTSYGTMLLWPFSDARIAWSWVAIVDPIYTGILAVGVIAAARRLSARPARLALLLSSLYLLLGFVQRSRALEATRALAQRRGHAVERIDAFPSPPSNLVWRTTYLTEGRVFVDRVRVPWWGPAATRPGGSTPLLTEAELPAAIHDDARTLAAFRLFRWFAGGWVAWEPQHPDVVGDLRYGHEGDASVASMWGVQLRPGEAVPVSAYRAPMGEGLSARWDALWGRD
ncbi:MAG: penicillin acylase family protein, partial [Myxococcales bacterium]|nr:penicillin acylase family protein [Myxococcales bacterium]